MLQQKTQKPKPKKTNYRPIPHDQRCNFFKKISKLKLSYIKDNTS